MMRIFFLAAMILTLLSGGAQAAGLISTYLSGSATAITSGGGNVVGFHYDSGGAAGLIEFRSDGASNAPTSGSAVRHHISTAGDNSNVWVELPSPGMEFRGGLYIGLTNVDNITIFYK